MRFRPCIDIHNGKVKQIVGSSLRDEGDEACENYVAEMSAADYAALFREDGLSGGHVILLNGRASARYEETAAEAESALRAWPGGLQVGGGITADNADVWLKKGASHVIVTSFVFRDGGISRENLAALTRRVGREHIVLDLSCRQRGDGDPSYYIATDRWQKLSRIQVTEALFAELSLSCDEFLVHGVAVEGKGGGVDEALIPLLAAAARAQSRPITYAGGIRREDDIRLLDRLSAGLLDYTVGSALDIYGGSLAYRALAGRRISSL